MEPLFGEGYHSGFDPQAYLQLIYSGPAESSVTFSFPHLYHHYQRLGTTNNFLNILDVGAGPSIANAISAAPYASEIVLSDYVEDNQKAIQQWMDKDPKAYNWMPYLNHIVVDIEGGKKKDIYEREEKLRSTIKITSCDASTDPVLPTEYMKQYDVVQSLRCLEVACLTRDDYTHALRRLAQLLKPNGTLILYHAERIDSPIPVQYPVGDNWFKYIRLSEEFITESLIAAGFSNITRVGREILPELQETPEDPVKHGFYTATYNNV